MQLPPFLPSPAEFALDDVVYREDASMTIIAHASPSTANCPLCGQASYRVHSRYRRRVADLPMLGAPVTCKMTVRRFYCRNASCSQRVFSERFQNTMGYRARETQRRTITLEKIALTCGGKPAERITRILGMPTSDSTLLRRIRRSPCAPECAATIVGIDDFSFKKGKTYGTIIVDHQKGHPIELLADREAETVEKWMGEHPDIAVVTRDRSGAYKAGIDAGAPQAIQVADRFHLLVNAREALQRVVEQKNSTILQAALRVTTPKQQEDASVSTKVAAAQAVTRSRDSRTQALSQSKRERRYQRYSEVMRLRDQGASIRGIAEATHLARGTIRRWLRAESFPERAPRCTGPVCTRSIMQHEPYLLQRIGEGMRNLTQLYQEIRDRGFRGSYRTVRRWASEHDVKKPFRAKNSITIPPEWHSPRAVTWLLMKCDGELTEQDGRFVDAVLKDDTVLAAARESVRDFARIIRERDHAKLGAWIETAKRTALGGFVDGIEGDREIVDAALRLPWSNGAVEGHVNRLKTIKRQMYGRAKFDLLRRRVLHTA